MEPMLTIKVKFNEESVIFPRSIFKDELFSHLYKMDNSKKMEVITFLVSLLKTEAINDDNDVIRMKIKKIKKMLD